MNSNRNNNEETNNLLMSVAKERQVMYNTMSDGRVKNDVKVTASRSYCSEAACVYFSISLVMLSTLGMLIYIYK